MNENLSIIGMIPDLKNKKMQIRMPFQRLGRNTYTIGGKGKTLRQMHVEYATMSGVLKAEMGIVFPFQWYGCLDIIDKVKATKHFKQGVKKGLNGYISEMKIKRAQLLYPPHGSTRMFHVGDFNKSTLMKFREGITDEEYYDLWESQGLVAHAKNKTLINSLIWKLQKSFNERGDKNAEVLALLCAGEAIIRLCLVHHNEKMKVFRDQYGYGLEDVHRCFEMFNIAKAAHQWHIALNSLDHNICEKLCEILDERNVVIGLKQIMEELTEVDNVLSITRENVVNNREIFRNKRTWLGEIQNIDEMIADAPEAEKILKEKIKEGKSIRQITEEEYYGKIKE